ncbi:MAG: HPr family phosphocarrier protein [Bacilli bacterium]|nr:HPr family phosphocarrier protein [Bacilli bacterium]
MKNVYIKINGISDLTQFVQKATLVDGDVFVEKGKFTVDGKSLLGMFSIDPTSGINVNYPDDAITFEEFITQFKA